MKKIFRSLRINPIILSLIFSSLVLCILTADASPKRGRAYHKSYRHGNAEGVFMIGPIGGLNRTNIDGAATFDNGYKYGFHAGVVSSIGVHPIIMVQPQLLYNVKGVQSIDGKFKYTMNYVEMRVLAQLLLTRNLSLLAGPYFGFLLSANQSIEGKTSDIKDKFSPFDFGLNGALEYKLKKGFGLGLQYSLGLADINTNGPGGYVAPARTHNVMQVSFFYMFTPSE